MAELPEPRVLGRKGKVKEVGHGIPKKVGGLIARFWPIKPRIGGFGKG